MKLLIICHAYNIDGATMVVYKSLLDEKLFNSFKSITIIAPRGAAMISKFKDLGCHALSVEYPEEGITQYVKRPFKNIRRLINLLKIILRNDFIWINSLDHTATIFSVCQYFKKPGFIYAHEGLGSPFSQHYCEPYKISKIKKLVEDINFKIAFPSRTTASDGALKIGITRKTYTPYGINVMRDTTKICKNNIVKFITVGWVCQRKGQYFMKYVLKELEKKVLESNGDLMDFVFTFAGIDWIANDHFMQDLLNNVSPSKIKFVNIMPNEDLLKELSNNDVLISNSYNEALPVNVMEAMSQEKLVIGSKCEGQDELIIDQVTGLSYEIGDYSTLVKHMIECLKPNNIQKVRELAANGKEHIKKNYNNEQFAQNINDIITN
jgi:glycosyltransferase involved in cell wall biosynthesis